MIIRSPLQVPNASRCLPRKYLSGSLNSPTMTESSSMRRPRSSVHRAREHILEKAARVRCYSWSFDSRGRNIFLTSSKSSWNRMHPRPAWLLLTGAGSAVWRNPPGPPSPIRASRGRRNPASGRPGAPCSGTTSKEGACRSSSHGSWHRR